MDDLKRWRRELHRIPELGLKEYKTSAYIRHELEVLGYEWEAILETGTIVYIDYHQKETIAFRSDIDGLAIHEKNQVDFRSEHEGCMHACGHDGHMSALLGFAERLKESKKSFPCNILLVFQPAEESPGAAKFVVEEGIFEKYNVKAIFGMHLMPFIDEGYIACKSGPLMAMCGEVDVKIKGQGSHAGLPQEGIDTIAIAGLLLEQYQMIISRRISPFTSAVLNIGKIVGGTARNSVASETCLYGTLRCYDEKVFDDITEMMNQIHESIEKSYGCEIEWSCPPMYPPVINHHQLYLLFQSLVDDQYIELEEPLMLAEDFAFYQRAIPGVFFFLGTKSDEYQSGLHTETFNFHEEILNKAVDLYEKIALNIEGE